MATIKMPQALINSMAQAEADALLEGLQDDELRKNDFVTTTETVGGEEIIRDVHNIPDLVDEDMLQ